MEQTNREQTQYELNKGLAQMLKGGVIMDVTTPEQAKIAEEARRVRRHGVGADSRRYPGGMVYPA